MPPEAATAPGVGHGGWQYRPPERIDCADHCSTAREPSPLPGLRTTKAEDNGRSNPVVIVQREKIQGWVQSGPRDEIFGPGGWAPRVACLGLSRS